MVLLSIDDVLIAKNCINYLLDTKFKLIIGLIIISINWCVRIEIFLDVNIIGDTKN